MAKRNKKTYQIKDKPKILIELTGQVGLVYVDDEALSRPQKGDLQVFANCEELHNDYQGMYDSLGFSGYFKVDVWDGRSWCPVILSELFPKREHYFSKKELPFDCYYLCQSILQSHKGRQLIRTYREHYDLVAE